MFVMLYGNHQTAPRTSSSSSSAPPSSWACCSTSGVAVLPTMVGRNGLHRHVLSASAVSRVSRHLRRLGDPERSNVPSPTSARRGDRLSEVKGEHPAPRGRPLRTFGPVCVDGLKSRKLAVGSPASHHLHPIVGDPARHGLGLEPPVILGRGWPQAAAISWPRVSRTVQATPPALTLRADSAPRASGSSHLPRRGVQRNDVDVHELTEVLHSRFNRSARHGWSLMSRINAYSIDTAARSVRVVAGRPQSLVDGPAVVHRNEFVAQLVVRRAVTPPTAPADPSANFLMAGANLTVDTVTERCEIPGPAGGPLSHRGNTHL